MYSLYDLSAIMPVLVAIIILVIALVFILVNGKNKQAKSSSINQRAFEELVQALQADHAQIKNELAAIRDDVSSIRRMMEEIQ